MERSIICDTLYEYNYQLYNFIGVSVRSNIIILALIIKEGFCKYEKSWEGNQYRKMNLNQKFKGG